MPWRADAPKVLIVEDEPTVAHAMATFFRLWRWNATKAASVAEALARLAEPFDLITLDLQLPDGSGADVLKEVRDRGLTTPVVVITGKPDEADSLPPLEPPDKLLKKPYLWAELEDYAAALHTKFHAGK